MTEPIRPLFGIETIGSVFLLDQTADQELSNMIAVQLPSESQEVEQLIQEVKEKGANVMGLQNNLEAIKQKGIEEGILRGREEGREEERAKGREEGIVLVARRLIDMGLDNAAVATATGMPEERIERLRSQIN